MPMPRYPRAEMNQLVPDSAHNIQAEKPETVLAAINRMLAECEPRKPKK